jgi:hypothetical protein
MPFSVRQNKQHVSSSMPALLMALSFDALCIDIATYTHTGIRHAVIWLGQYLYVF